MSLCIIPSKIIMETNFKNKLRLVDLVFLEIFGYKKKPPIFICYH